MSIESISPDESFQDFNEILSSIFISATFIIFSVVCASFVVRRNRRNRFSIVNGLLLVSMGNVICLLSCWPIRALFATFFKSHLIMMEDFSNVVCHFTNISLVFSLPFAYLYQESGGVFKNNVISRIARTIIEILLVFCMEACLLFVCLKLMDEPSFSILSDLAIVSLFTQGFPGIFLFALCIPIGISKIISDGFNQQSKWILKANLRDRFQSYNWELKHLRRFDELSCNQFSSERTNVPHTTIEEFLGFENSFDVPTSPYSLPTTFHTSSSHLSVAVHTNEAPQGVDTVRKLHKRDVYRSPPLLASFKCVAVNDLPTFTQESSAFRVSMKPLVLQPLLCSLIPKNDLLRRFNPDKFRRKAETMVASCRKSDALLLSAKAPFLRLLMWKLLLILVFGNIVLLLCLPFLKLELLLGKEGYWTAAIRMEAVLFVLFTTQRGVECVASSLEISKRQSSVSSRLRRLMVLTALWLTLASAFPIEGQLLAIISPEENLWLLPLSFYDSLTSRSEWFLIRTLYQGLFLFVCCCLLCRVCTGMRFSTLRKGTLSY
eukprot:TRINITY_DN5976_c0_g2_i2.p1 TRINITY_DN5976_c0_g2~~TRINITY_DN5976_c0_g2_i2.p1  ORF type:complete len:548 (-),score=24.63 TRINITY_DN5976_c0_g2_i2:49-1692(-)